jgi:ethanolamine utilization protein EutA (predicted chaperonin)
VRGDSNVPVIAPALPLAEEKIDPAAIAAAIKSALKRLDLDSGESSVAVFVSWRGSATFSRLDDFCKGIAEGLKAILTRGNPIVLAGDGDVGGLIGIHYCEEMKIDNPIVSIDGLELKEFDYIDIGTILDTLGRSAGRHQIARLSDRRRARQELAGGVRDCSRLRVIFLLTVAWGFVRCTKPRR